MISYLNGKIDQLEPAQAIIECNGIGYSVSISLNTFKSLQGKKEAKVYTQFIVREDAQLLYGFYTTEEKNIFKALISVNGVGPASGMMMISTLTTQEIAIAILSSNSKLLEKVKGIGAKTAQRIIIDLKDKIGNVEFSQESLPILGNKIKEEALSALEILGIGKKLSEKRADKILELKPDILVEDLIKEILKNI